MFLYSGITIDDRVVKTNASSNTATLNRPQNSAGAKGRQRLALFVSADECQTWREKEVIHAGPAAYSDLVVLTDGSALCFYEAGEESAYESIRLAHLSADRFGK